MIARILALLLCLTMLALPVICHADASDKARSCWWTGFVHEENSLVASVLYLPYIILIGPVSIVQAIIDPKPATQGTIPPPAHRVSH